MEDGKIRGYFSTFEGANSGANQFIDDGIYSIQQVTTGAEFQNSGSIFDVLLGCDIICKGAFPISFDARAISSS
jgi:hypothetical protein